MGRDLIFEQVLIRSIKTKGLTRDSELSESVQAPCVLSMLASCEFSLVMRTFARIVYSTSEQHKEMHNQHKNKIEKMVLDCCIHSTNSHFTSDQILRNIVTGCTFETNVVNVQKILGIKKELIRKLLGKDERPCEDISIILKQKSKQ